MCGQCWASVPADLQRAVYETVGLRVRDPNKSPDASWAPWWRAQAHAIHAALKQGAVYGRWVEIPGAFDNLLAKDLEFADHLERKGFT